MKAKDMKPGARAKLALRGYVSTTGGTKTASDYFLGERGQVTTKRNAAVFEDSAEAFQLVDKIFKYGTHGGLPGNLHLVRISKPAESPIDVGCEL